MSRASFAWSLIAVLGIGCSSSSSDGAGGATDASTSADGGVDSSSTADSSAQDAAPPFDASAIVAARPYTLHAPTGLDTTKAAPLVVMFHGYGATGVIQESLMRLAAASDAHGFLYAYGEGTTDQDSSQFWNATDGCCDLYGSHVDDVAYFDAIVDDISAKYKVDPKRIFVVGHSNGAFMTHRLACDRASRVAGIVALAGDNWIDPTKCNPSEHVAIMQVHGDADMTIIYTGGMTKEGMYPSAHDSVASWAKKNGCTGALAPTGATADLDVNLAGAETKIETYGGCPAGVDVALWTIQGGAHIPTLNHPTWGEDVWTFFAAHPKQ